MREERSIQGATSHLSNRREGWLRPTTLAILILATATSWASVFVGCGSGGSEAQQECERFLSAYCDRLASCYPSDLTTASCLSAAQAKVDCSKTVAVTSNYDACMAQIPTYACASLKTALPSVCEGVIQQIGTSGSGSGGASGTGSSTGTGSGSGGARTSSSPTTSGPSTSNTGSGITVNCDTYSVPGCDLQHSSSFASECRLAGCTWNLGTCTTDDFGGSSCGCTCQ